MGTAAGRNTLTTMDGSPIDDGMALDSIRLPGDTPRLSFEVPGLTKARSPG